MKTCEQIEAMSDEERRFKTAELCGWKVGPSLFHEGTWSLFDPSGKQRGGSWSLKVDAWKEKIRGFPKIPDYLNSLDVAQETWQCMGWEEKNECTECLKHVVKEADCVAYWATARQRNTALLMVML